MNNVKNNMHHRINYLPSFLQERLEYLSEESLIEFEFWFANQQSRLPTSMRRITDSGDVIEDKEEYPAFINMLIKESISENINTKKIEAILNLYHKELLKAENILYLISLSMSCGVAEEMRARGKVKSRSTTKKLKLIGELWLKHKRQGKNKQQAAIKIAEEVNLAPGTVYNHLTNNLESNTRIYPDGIEAAEQQLASLYSLPPT